MAMRKGDRVQKKPRMKIRPSKDTKDSGLSYSQGDLAEKKEVTDGAVSK